MRDVRAMTDAELDRAHAAYIAAGAAIPEWSPLRIEERERRARDRRKIEQFATINDRRAVVDRRRMAA